MKKFFNDFRTFAIQGNVIDLAVGVVIGTAFGKIVTSLVNDIIMPLIGLLMGKVNLVNLKWVVNSTVKGVSTPLVIPYGNFIQSIIDFALIAFSIFIFIKIINKIRKKFEKEKEKEELAEISKTEVLLEEIRDLLKEKK